MRACDNCSGDGGWEIVIPAQSKWGDPTPGGEWVSCPTCDGAGWLDEDAEPLDMGELDERCGAIERVREGERG